jgi:hypothetical protein
MVKIKNPAYDVYIDLESMELRLLDKRLNEGKIGFREPYYDLYELDSICLIAPGGRSFMLEESNIKNGFDLCLFEKQNHAEAVLLFVDGKSQHLLVDCDGLAELIRVLHKRFTIDVQVPRTYNSEKYRPLSEGSIRYATHVSEKIYVEKRLRILTALKSLINKFVTPLVLMFVFFGLGFSAISPDIAVEVGNAPYFALVILIVTHVVSYCQSAHMNKKITEELKQGAGQPQSVMEESATRKANFSNMCRERD